MEKHSKEEEEFKGLLVLSSVGALERFKSDLCTHMHANGQCGVGVELQHMVANLLILNLCKLAS